MIDKHLTSDEKNILKKVLQLQSAFVVLHRQTTKRNDNEIQIHKRQAINQQG